MFIPDADFFPSRIRIFPSQIRIRNTGRYVHRYIFELFLTFRGEDLTTSGTSKPAIIETLIGKTSE